jgi:hypothetical protein
MRLDGAGVRVMLLLLLLLLLLVLLLLGLLLLFPDRATQVLEAPQGRNAARRDAGGVPQAGTAARV